MSFLAPPNITEPGVRFSCNVSLDHFAVEISWMVSNSVWHPCVCMHSACVLKMCIQHASYYSQTGIRMEGVLYPGDVSVSVILSSDLNSRNLVCSVVTNTSCTVNITRDIYTVTINQSNDIGSSVCREIFDGMSFSCLSTLIVPLLTARILLVTEEILNSDAESLSVTVTVNELCPSDRDYLVLVTFGTRPLASNGSDCKGQVNTTVMTVTSGDSTIFCVAADTVILGDDEEYCYRTNTDG